MTPSTVSAGYIKGIVHLDGVYDLCSFVQWMPYLKPRLDLFNSTWRYQFYKEVFAFAILLSVAVLRVSPAILALMS